MLRAASRRLRQDSRGPAHEFLDADEWQGWNAMLMVNRTVLQALVIEHAIADWDLWKPVFDEHAASRVQHGCIREELFRSPDGATI